MRDWDWWREVPGYEGHYQVSRAGDVYSRKRRRLLAQVEGDRGYFTVNLYRNGEPEHCLVHRLVAEGEERQRLYDAQAALMPAFAEYQEKTTRQIPVIILERIG